MAIIPDFKPAGGTKSAEVASLGSVMAAGKAMQSVGGSLMDAAGTVSAHFERQQAENDQAAKNRARLAMQKAAAEHQLFREQNPDESKWEADMTERLGAVKTATDAERVSSRGREDLNLMVSGWDSEYRLGTAADATRFRRSKNRTEQTQLVEAYTRAGRFDDARKVMDEGVSSGLFSRGEFDADKVDLEDREKDWKEKEAEKREQNDIAADPAGWWEQHKDKAPEGMDAVKYQRMRDYAKGRLAERTFEDADVIEDGIASGSITTPEQIDKTAGDLRPSVREKLKDSLARRQSAEFKAQAATPEYQHQVIGEVGGMLRDWNPEDQGFDERWVEMAGKVRTLPPGPVRDELERQMGAVRSGRAGEVKTHADAAQKALDEAHKAGRFGKIPKVEPIVTQKAINDGFLKDPAKLGALGFSPEQITEINADVSKGHPATNTSRENVFKQLWEQRSGKGKESADKLTMATADSIVQGKSNVDFSNPEAEDAAISARLDAERKYGAAKQKLAEWIKLNPNATREQIDDQVQGIAGEEEMRKLKSGIYERKDDSPKGASADTAAAPVGKNLTEVVKNFEAADGFHRAAYWDYGQWSIGYGTKAKEGEVIDQAEADRRLASELGSARAEVEAEAKRVGVSLRSNELDALTSFQFNTGKISTLLNGGKRTKAEIAAAMLLYRNADGQRLRGLERRRSAERKLFLSGYGGDAATAANGRNTGEFAQYNVITE